MNAMTYNFYGPSGSPNFTSPPAALYKTTASQINADEGIRAWIGAGMNAKKIVLGLPFYGCAWKLVNANNHGLLAPAISEKGDRGYNQIRNKDSSTVFNGSVGTNYCYSRTPWIGYMIPKVCPLKFLTLKGKGCLVILLGMLELMIIGLFLEPVCD